MISQLLQEGDPKTLGKANHIAKLISQDQSLFSEAFEEMLHNPKFMARLRAGNAVEKAARQHPELLLPFKEMLLKAVSEMRGPEIVWHVPLLLGYVPLEEDDLALAVNKLYEWLDTVDNKFVKVFCVQSLAVLALQHDWLKPEVTETVKAALDSESAAMKARARMLLKMLEPKRKR